MVLMKPLRWDRRSTGVNSRQCSDTSKIGKSEGARLIVGGQALRDGDYAYGFFHQPTIFADVQRTMRIAQEEIFGPVLSIITVDSLEEAIDVANDVPYGLSSAIYTRDVNAAFRAMRDLYTGIVYVNAPTIGAEIHLPFGGTKGTGQWSPRRRHSGARRFQRVEIDLHRFFGNASAGADRHLPGGDG
jgi:acyl-CoA reductase-like NAD-dependent aldehyde dehydrogenase